MGTPNVGGTTVTAGRLIFVAATNDSKFRAFNSRTGEELWSVKLEASGNATPITYQGRSGKQYVVIVAGGPAHLRTVGNTANNADSVVAFALGGRAGLPWLPRRRRHPRQLEMRLVYCRTAPAKGWWFGSARPAMASRRLAATA